MQNEMQRGGDLHKQDSCRKTGCRKWRLVQRVSDVPSAAVLHFYKPGST